MTRFAHVLAGRDRDRRDAAGDRGVAEHVVGAGRLLDPGEVERRESVDPLDRLGDVPALVGVDRDPDVGPDGRAGDPQAAHVVARGRRRP